MVYSSRSIHQQHACVAMQTAIGCHDISQKARLPGFISDVACGREETDHAHYPAAQSAGFNAGMI